MYPHRKHPPVAVDPAYSAAECDWRKNEQHRVYGDERLYADARLSNPLSPFFTGAFVGFVVGMTVLAFVLALI